MHYIEISRRAAIFRPLTARLDGNRMYYGNVRSHLLEEPEKVLDVRLNIMYLKSSDNCNHYYA